MRIKSLLPGLLAALLLGGCGEEASFGQEEGCRAVRLELLEPESANRGQGTFVLSLNPGFEEEIWYYDEYFRLERQEDEAFAELPLAGEFAESTLYMEIKAEAAVKLEVSWEEIYGELPAGVYRMVRQVFPQRDASANQVIWELLSWEERGNFSRNPGPDPEAGELVSAVFEIPEK